MQEDHVLTEREVPVPDQSVEIVSQRATQYLESIGYRKVGDAPLQFDRGSKRGTPFAFSPKKWHAVVTIGMTPGGSGTHVKASYDVDKTGQLVSAREALFWDDEIAALESALKGHALVIRTEHDSRASRENVSSIVVLLLSLLAVAVALFGLMFILPRPILSVARFVLPIAAVWFAIWLWSRFQERQNKRVLSEEGKLPPGPVEPS